MTSINQWILWALFVPLSHNLLPCSCTRRLWEASLGKYDNWCLFIVIQICSTAQWNTTPQRLWLAAPGPKTSKIIQISTTSSLPSNHFLIFYAKICLSSHNGLDSGCFPLCVRICAHSFSGGMGWCKAFGRFSQQQWKCTFKISSCSGYPLPLLTEQPPFIWLYIWFTKTAFLF